jgi:putative ABC transport system permease protein
MSITGVFDSVGRDLRYALRGLAQRPAFASAAVLTLALGIGATTAIFSVVYSVLIKPLPYPNADELVTIRYSAAADSGARLRGSEPSMHFTYRDETRTLAGLGFAQPQGVATLTILGEAERVQALQLTQGTLETLGVAPIRGRAFTEAEHGPAVEGPLPVILSYAFWQRRFGGDEAVLGRELSIEAPTGIDTLPLAGAAQVVGIMPPDFRFLDVTPDVILAVRLDPARQMILGNFSTRTIARLKPGVTPAEARADIERMFPIWLDAWPLPFGLTREVIASAGLTPIVRPLKDDMVGSVASTLWVLMGAIGAVLVVACANIANLMLVRAEARRQEFAVRAALGAVPARIARELLIESFSLGAAGGVLGVVLAYVGLEALIAVAPRNLPRLQEIAVYGPVLAFAVAASLASTLLFGSITALKHARNIDAPRTFGARGASASRERNATRNTLVIVQVALALVLVVSAALMIRTFEALHDVDPGFSDPATIQTVFIAISPTVVPDPAQYTRMEHEILDKIAALPGVSSAGFTDILPLGLGYDFGPMAVEGQTLAPGDRPPARRRKFVSPGYFEAMGTRVIAGRDVTWSDIESGGRVAVISENFARELAAEPAGALGLRIRHPIDTDDWREVIGVVQNVHEIGLHEEAPSFVYYPVLVVNMYSAPVIGKPAVAFVIRSERAGTASLVEEVRQAVRSVSGSVPVSQPRTMQDIAGGSLARTSFTLVMLAIAGAMALALGVIGIYGVMAYVVSQRTREIGIRSALGAEPRQLKKMFLLHGLALSGVGAVVGLVAAIGLGRLMSSLLFGVTPTDPIAYVAALAVVIAAALLASYVPARRAANVDPIETLRAE